MLKRIILAVLVSMFLAGSANAWYFDLQDQGGGSYEIWFISDGATQPAFATDAIALTVAYTGSVVATAAGPHVTAAEAYGGTNLSAFPDVDSGGFYTWTWTNLSAMGSIGNANTFPVPGYFNDDAPDLLMASITVTGGAAWDYNNDSGLFMMNIDGVMKDAPALVDMDALNPPDTVIPIPGAIYLMASGLIGLIGLRRRA